nr:ABC transporter permease subunit [Fredinandcohnia onubensis]
MQAVYKRVKPQQELRQRKKSSLGLSWKQYKLYYILMLPGLAYFLIFHYLPMFGLFVAFKDVSPFGGLAEMWNSEWVGFKHFDKFFDSYYFWDVLGNTVIISFLKLMFGFTTPIIFALLLNEIRIKWFKKSIQTISYLPHFISMVVVTGMVNNLLSTHGGIVNAIIQFFGGEPIAFLVDSNYFRSVLVITDIWKGIGWESIIYLAAMASIDPQLYESAKVDGANRFKQMWHITLPGISFVICILLILNIGNFLEAGFEQILLLYSPSVYEVADIIDTYVYRLGLVNMEYSFAAAVGLFQNVIGAVLILAANYIVKKMGHQGLW